MAKKYHISPKTDRPGICRTLHIRGCPYGEHYSSMEDAQRAIEQTALQSAGDSLPVSQSRPPRGPSVPLAEIRVADEKIDPRYHFQELWARDEAGTPAVYAKVNLISDGPGGSRPGLVLCDIEINPALRGQGHALEFLRSLKTEHGVEAIELTGMLSEDGYRMYQKMKEHEERTGEKIFEIQRGEKLSEPKPGKTYSFVADWAEEKAEYPL